VLIRDTLLHNTLQNTIMVRLKATHLSVEGAQDRFQRRETEADGVCSLQTAQQL
jgi:hypothetical protein